MSRDEKTKIEEMAVDLCLLDDCKHLSQEECDLTTCAHCMAEALYEKGYRKESDAACEAISMLVCRLVGCSLHRAKDISPQHLIEVANELKNEYTEREKENG